MSSHTHSDQTATITASSRSFTGVCSMAVGHVHASHHGVDDHAYACYTMWTPTHAKEHTHKPIYHTHTHTLSFSLSHTRCHSLTHTPSHMYTLPHRGRGGEEEEEEDGDEVVSWNLRKCSAAGLDVLSTVFGDELLPIVLPIVQAHMQSADWRARESATLALGAISEGCAQGLLPYLQVRAAVKACGSGVVGWWCW